MYELKHYLILIELYGILSCKFGQNAINKLAVTSILNSLNLFFVCLGRSLMGRMNLSPSFGEKWHTVWDLY